MPYQALGIDPTQVVEATGIPEFPLGTIGEDQKGNRFIYVRANGATTEKFPVALDVNFDVVDGNGVICDAVIMETLADNEYGWAQISGVCSDVNVEAGTSAGDLLAMVADANGDFQAASNPDTSGTAQLAAIRAKALTNIASNVSDILLYNWL